ITFIILMIVFVKIQRYLVDIPILDFIPWFVSKVYHHWGKLLMKIPGISSLVQDKLFTDHARMAREVTVISALGISYYTFSLISYLVDVYWRKDTAERNYFKLLAFVIYFPKILQGPISRHKELAPQFFEKHSFDYKQICFGLQRMLWGFFKKLAIAERLGVFVGTVFGNVAKETGAHLLVAALLCAVQAYSDFSGYMDIACGFSECLGLKLAENFDHPFFSKSAAEFWRRWHMTLGTWVKDYIYMPLAFSPFTINFAKSVRKYLGVRMSQIVMTAIPLLAAWLFTGLWHGTGWNYVVWGLYWCSLIFISTVFEPDIKKLTAFFHIDTEEKSWKIFQMVRTFMFFAIGVIFTRLGSLEKSLLAFQKIFTNFHPENFFDGSFYRLGLDRPNFTLGIISIFILWGISLWQEKSSVREDVARSNIIFRWAFYYLAIFSIIIFGMYGPNYNAKDFLYMQF
ncbi:MAG: MBOAT family protein, partial [Synergistaceae bacterium]|nr:MBOAT family protein [Synergistaceae bacterium]